MQWTETVRAKDYIDFLRVLWERVRPDLLFSSTPRGARGRTSLNPFEISGERSSGLPGSKTKKTHRRGANYALTPGSMATAIATNTAGGGGKISTARIARAR